MFFYIRNLVALQQSLSLDKISVFYFLNPQQQQWRVHICNSLEPRTRWRQNWAFDTLVTDHEKNVASDHENIVSGHEKYSL